MNNKPDPSTDSYGYMIWILWQIANMRHSDPEEMRRLALDGLASSGTIP